jgi:hypothetical protein
MQAVEVLVRIELGLEGYGTILGEKNDSGRESSISER